MNALGEALAIILIMLAFVMCCADKGLHIKMNDKEYNFKVGEK